TSVSVPASPSTMSLPSPGSHWNKSSPAPRRATSLPYRQIDVDLLGVGAGEVVHRDLVGAAQGVELDVLDAIEVHGDVADVAGDPHAAAVGRGVEGLGELGAVEQQGAGTVPALDNVAAVAGSHWNTSSPAPSEAVSLPWFPSMKSFPSPP